MVLVDWIVKKMLIVMQLPTVVLKQELNVLNVIPIIVHKEMDFVHWIVTLIQIVKLVLVNSKNVLNVKIL